MFECLFSLFIGFVICTVGLVVGVFFLYKVCLHHVALVLWYVQRCCCSDPAPGNSVNIVRKFFFLWGTIDKESERDMQ